MVNTNNNSALESEYHRKLYKMLNERIRDGENSSVDVVVRPSPPSSGIASDESENGDVPHVLVKPPLHNATRRGNSLKKLYIPASPASRENSKSMSNLIVPQDERIPRMSVGSRKIIDGFYTGPTHRRSSSKSNKQSDNLVLMNRMTANSSSSSSSSSASSENCFIFQEKQERKMSQVELDREITSEEVITRVYDTSTNEGGGKVINGVGLMLNRTNSTSSHNNHRLHSVSSAATQSNNQKIGDSSLITNCK